MNHTDCIVSYNPDCNRDALITSHSLYNNTTIQYPTSTFTATNIPQHSNNAQTLYNNNSHSKYMSAKVTSVSSTTKSPISNNQANNTSTVNSHHKPITPNVVDAPILINVSNSTNTVVSSAPYSTGSSNRVVMCHTATSSDYGSTAPTQHAYNDVKYYPTQHKFTKQFTALHSKHSTAATRMIF